LVAAVVHTADIQDRDGAPDVLTSLRTSFPWLRHVFADGAMLATSCVAPSLGAGDGRSKSSSDPTLPRASRCFPADGRGTNLCLVRAQPRLAKDFENTLESSTAWLLIAFVQLMTRRLLNPSDQAETL
jgi:hypothetical protein